MRRIPFEISNVFVSRWLCPSELYLKVDQNTEHEHNDLFYVYDQKTSVKVNTTVFVLSRYIIRSIFAK